MADLSPAAAAALKAFMEADAFVDGRLSPGPGLAAAFRALAVRIKGADAIRQDVLDIADELETHR